jgi:hypothetical protein
MKRVLSLAYNIILVRLPSLTYLKGGTPGNLSEAARGPQAALVSEW